MFELLPNSNVHQCPKSNNNNNNKLWGKIECGIHPPSFNRNLINSTTELKKIVFLSKNLKMVNISKMKWEKIEMTTLCTNPEQSEKQTPHTYYEIVQTDSPDNLAWTAHLPLNKNEGKLVDILQQFKKHFEKTYECAMGITFTKKLNTINVYFYSIDTYLKDKDIYNQGIFSVFTTFFHDTGIFELGVLKDEILCSIFWNFSDNAQ